MLPNTPVAKAKTEAPFILRDFTVLYRILIVLLFEKFHCTIFPSLAPFGCIISSVGFR